MDQAHSELVHNLRKQVDACIEAVNSAKGTLPPQGQRELALSYTKLQEAKMWLGKVLEALGSELPAEYQDKAE